MSFARFMASPLGRFLRGAAGVALVALGVLQVGGIAGWVIAAVGLVPLLAGVFNVCLIAALIGAPFRGSAVDAATPPTKLSTVG